MVGSTTGVSVVPSLILIQATTAKTFLGFSINRIETRNACELA
jgi:hypothetical protein